jgi:hypothetical protein
VDTATQAAWKYLHDQWRIAYTLQHDRDSSTPYTATRRDTNQRLQAETVESLRALIRRDYAEHPVPHEATP